jgi:Flp pilus assembly protein TadG
MKIRRLLASVMPLSKISMHKPYLIAKRRKGYQRAISRQRQSGAFVIVFLVMVSVLVPLGGLALDGSRYFQARAQLSRALEAAVQAASADEGCDSAVARQYLESYLNFESSKVLSLNTMNLECGSQNRLSASINVKGFIWPQITIHNVEALVRLSGSANPIEISFVVDISGSMASAISDLRTGLTRFIERLPVDSAGQLQNAKVAIIPFSGEVLNRQLSGSVDCYRVGTGPAAALVRADWESMMGALRNGWPDRLSSLCSGNEQSHSLFLTGDSNQLKTHAAQLQATGTTDIELGVIWGWRALDPRWLSYKPQAARSGRYGSAKKIMILFTDADGIAAEHMTASGTNSLCGSIKSRNIEIFTIKLGSITGNSVMEQCASSPEHFQASPSSAQLDQLFDNISSKIGTKYKLSL